MDDLLKKFDIDRSTLTLEELETLDKWIKMLSGAQLSVADIKENISSMILSLEKELYGHETPPVTFANLFFWKRKKRHMEARLHNYIMLRDFLTAPDRARSYVEKQLGGFIK